MSPDAIFALPTEAAGSLGPPRWNAATRFAFRVWLVFSLLLVLPRSAEFFVNAGVWPFIAKWIGLWPITHVLHRPDRVLAGPMSGADYLPDYIAAGVIALLSFLVAVCWSLMPRADRDHPRAFVALHTIVRFALGSLLLYYAWDKILPGQFGDGPNFEKVARPVAQLTPMELLWAFMSSSRTYTLFSGIAEFAGGVLLFARRTALLGAVIAAIAMANVLMLDIAYDVSVKFLAGLMLVMALSLIAPRAVRVGRIFLLHDAIGLPSVEPLFTMRRLDDATRVVGVCVAIVMVCWTWAMAHRIVVDDAVTGSFHGVWEIESMERDGTPVPLVVTDSALWRRLVFPGDDAAAFVDTMADTEIPYRAAVDQEKTTLTLTPRPFAIRQAKQSRWVFAFADGDRLHLRSNDAAATSTVMVFKRVDTAQWSIVAHRHVWRW